METIMCLFQNWFKLTLGWSLLVSIGIGFWFLILIVLTFGEEVTFEDMGAIMWRMFWGVWLCGSPLAFMVSNFEVFKSWHCPGEFVFILCILAFGWFIGTATWMVNSND